MNVDELVKNYPKLDKPREIDLVIDGGAFNGSYTLGGLLLIKKLEEINYLKVKRISGSSIGSLLGVMYFNNSLDSIYELDKRIKAHFKKNLNLKIAQDLMKQEVDGIPDDVFIEMKNEKLYVSYFKNGKERCIKKKYKDKKDLVETLMKSCHVPYLIDKNFYCEKDKAIDGIFAYIFKNLERETIFYDNKNIRTMFNLKNEKNSTERMMEGMLKTHKLLLKNQPSDLCNYLNEWGNYDYFKRNIKLLLTYIVLKIISTIYDIYHLFKDFFVKNERFKEINYGEINCKAEDVINDCIKKFCISYIFENNAK